MELAPSNASAAFHTLQSVNSGGGVQVTAADLLTKGVDAVVRFRFPDGAVRTVSARKLLERAGDNAPVWLRGPIATQWLLAASPEDEDGKPRRIEWSWAKRDLTASQSCLTIG